MVRQRDELVDQGNGYQRIVVHVALEFPHVEQYNIQVVKIGRFGVGQDTFRGKSDHVQASGICLEDQFVAVVCGSPIWIGRVSFARDDVAVNVVIIEDHDLAKVQEWFDLVRVFHKWPTLLKTGEKEIVLTEQEFDQPPHWLLHVGGLPEECQRTVLDEENVFQKAGLSFHHESNEVNQN